MDITEVDKNEPLLVAYIRQKGDSKETLILEKSTMCNQFLLDNNGIKLIFIAGSSKCGQSELVEHLSENFEIDQDYAAPANINWDPINRNGSSALWIIPLNMQLVTENVNESQKKVCILYMNLTEHDGNWGAPTEAMSALIGSAFSICNTNVLLFPRILHEVNIRAISKCLKYYTVFVQEHGDPNNRTSNLHSHQLIVVVNRSKYEKGGIRAGTELLREKLSLKDEHNRESRVSRELFADVMPQPKCYLVPASGVDGKGKESSMAIKRSHLKAISDEIFRTTLDELSWEKINIRLSTCFKIFNEQRSVELYKSLDPQLTATEIFGYMKEAYQLYNNDFNSNVADINKQSQAEIEGFHDDAIENALQEFESNFAVQHNKRGGKSVNPNFDVDSRPLQNRILNDFELIMQERNKQASRSMEHKRINLIEGYKGQMQSAFGNSVERFSIEDIENLSSHFKQRIHVEYSKFLNKFGCCDIDNEAHQLLEVLDREETVYTGKRGNMGMPDQKNGHQHLEERQLGRQTKSDIDVETRSDGGRGVAATSYYDDGDGKRSFPRRSSENSRCGSIKSLDEEKNETSYSRSYCAAKSDSNVGWKKSSPGNKNQRRVSEAIDERGQERRRTVLKQYTTGSHDSEDTWTRSEFTPQKYITRRQSDSQKSQPDSEEVQYYERTRTNVRESHTDRSDMHSQRQYPLRNGFSDDQMAESDSDDGIQRRRPHQGNDRSGEFHNPASRHSGGLGGRQHDRRSDEFKRHEYSGSKSFGIDKEKEDFKNKRVLASLNTSYSRRKQDEQYDQERKYSVDDVDSRSDSGSGRFGTRYVETNETSRNNQTDGRQRLEFDGQRRYESKCPVRPYRRKVPNINYGSRASQEDVCSGSEEESRSPPFLNRSRRC